MPSLLSKVLVKDKEANKYLILRTGLWRANPRRSLKPDLPGGAVEENETALQGAIRELREETGIIADSDKLKLIMEIQENHGGVDFLRSMYFYEAVSPEVVLSWEHDMFWWMSAEEVLALDIREPYPDFFRKLSEENLLR